MVGDFFSFDGSDWVGNGDFKVGDVLSILVWGGRIEGFVIGDNWNFDGCLYMLIRCIMCDVDFVYCM